MRPGVVHTRPATCSPTLHSAPECNEWECKFRTKNHLLLPRSVPRSPRKISTVKKKKYTTAIKRYVKTMSFFRVTNKRIVRIVMIQHTKHDWKNDRKPDSANDSINFPHIYAFAFEGANDVTVTAFLPEC